MRLVSTVLGAAALLRPVRSLTTAPTAECAAKDAMPKTILLTGATDGIGLETAKMLLAKEPSLTLLVHGRTPAKVDATVETLQALAEAPSTIQSFTCDLSRLRDVEAFAEAVKATHSTLDVIINNAGVFNTPEPRTADALDTRFAVNTLAPYLLTKKLLPVLKRGGRVVNLSSAAQAPVDLAALGGHRTGLAAFDAYAQSKLAITMWSQKLAKQVGDAAVVTAVNPGSLLGSKMVKEAFGTPGSDLRIGADVITRAALSSEFGPAASGRYFDNDSGRFAPPHADARDARTVDRVVDAIEAVLAEKGVPV